MSFRGINADTGSPVLAGISAGIPGPSWPVARGKLSHGQALAELSLMDRQSRNCPSWIGARGIAPRGYKSLFALLCFAWLGLPWLCFATQLEASYILSGTPARMRCITRDSWDMDVYTLHYKYLNFSISALSTSTIITLAFLANELTGDPVALVSSRVPKATIRSAF